MFLLATVAAYDICQSLSVLLFGHSLHALDLVGLLTPFITAAGVLVLSFTMLDRGNLLLIRMACGWLPDPHDLVVVQQQNSAFNHHGITVHALGELVR